MPIRVSIRGGFDEVGVRVVKAKCKALYDALIKHSPVYTGSYRASWTISLNRMDLNYVTGGSSAAPLPPPKFTFPAGYKLGDKIVFGNRTPYAERLENGWSSQAPAGVVKVAVTSVTFR
jgi:hypothetical protein